ncbi:MAG: hypothetical protein KF862_20805 [Chitinophagaceae bacterium]|nr:hypothetical protein [Chitinophagaceae bacterium]
MKPASNKYNQLLDSIGLTIEQARQNAFKAVNTELVKANWEIGRHIVEYEQHGQERAEYGSELLSRLSKDLRQRYGKGFGRRNILDMRRFYLAYQKWQAVPAKLSWTHFITLLAVSDDTARKFYEKQAILENWGYRELERQIDSSLFERLALSKDKKRCVATFRERVYCFRTYRSHQRPLCFGLSQNTAKSQNNREST